MFIEPPNFVKEVLIFDEILCVQDSGFEMQMKDVLVCLPWFPLGQNWHFLFNNMTFWREADDICNA